MKLVWRKLNLRTYVEGLFLFDKSQDNLSFF